MSQQPRVGPLRQTDPVPFWEFWTNEAVTFTFVE
jgi:hypothetical protein